MAVLPTEILRGHCTNGSERLSLQLCQRTPTQGIHQVRPTSILIAAQRDCPIVNCRPRPVTGVYDGCTNRGGSRWGLGSARGRKISLHVRRVQPTLTTRATRVLLPTHTSFHFQDPNRGRLTSVTRTSRFFRRQDRRPLTRTRVTVDLSRVTRHRPRLPHLIRQRSTRINTITRPSLRQQVLNPYHQP